MRLEYIRSFIGVVNYKSFSLAAKYLYLSQPTISTHIKQLENELGVQLLIRSTKDVLLSEEGKIFYPYALQLIETENTALKHLNKCENESGGTITLALSSVPAYYMFPKFLSQFRKKNSGISFKVHKGDSGDVIRKILDYEAEIGIGGLESGSEKIHSEIIFEDEIVIITPNTAAYREMDGKFPIDNLKNECFITREIGSGTKNTAEYIEQELKLDLTSMKIVAQFESSEMVRRAVEEGSGIAFVSKYTAKESVEKQKILEFKIPGVNTKREFYLMYLRTRELNVSTEMVIRGLKEYCSKNLK